MRTVLFFGLLAACTVLHGQSPPHPAWGKVEFEIVTNPIVLGEYVWVHIKIHGREKTMVPNPKHVGFFCPVFFGDGIVGPDGKPIRKTSGDDLVRPIPEDGWVPLLPGKTIEYTFVPRRQPRTPGKHTLTAVGVTREIVVLDRKKTERDIQTLYFPDAVSGKLTLEANLSIVRIEDQDHLMARVASLYRRVTKVSDKASFVAVRLDEERAAVAITTPDKHLRMLTINPFDEQIIERESKYPADGSQSEKTTPIKESQNEKNAAEDR